MSLLPRKHIPVVLPQPVCARCASALLAHALLIMVRLVPTTRGTPRHHDTAQSIYICILLKSEVKPPTNRPRCSMTIRTHGCSERVLCLSLLVSSMSRKRGSWPPRTVCTVDVTAHCWCDHCRTWFGGGGAGLYMKSSTPNLRSLGSNVPVNETDQTQRKALFDKCSRTNGLHAIQASFAVDARIMLSTTSTAVSTSPPNTSVVLPDTLPRATLQSVNPGSAHGTCMLAQC